MEYQYASRGTGSAALTTGIIGTAGTALGLLGNNIGGLWGNRGYEHERYATKEDLHYVAALAQKDSEIALLKSEQNTEIKIADVYERVMAKVNANFREQSDINAAQAVYNATSNSAINLLQNQVAILNGLTKTVVPITNICPQPMEKYNSWTEPTTVTATA